MQVFKELAELPQDADTVVTLGTFDGIHLGHQEIIKQLLEVSEKKHLKNIVVTFHPHPRSVLSRGNGIKILSTLDEKAKILEKLGVENLFLIKFTKEFAGLSPAEFIKQYLVNGAGMKEIVIGFDHHFGKGRQGNIDFLKSISEKHNFVVTPVQPFEKDGIIISSTKIRNALTDGDIKAAENMLGRRYSFSGKVVSGDKRGRDLGYPTANISPDDPGKLLPAIGIYAVKVLMNESRLNGLLSIGKRPTFLTEGEIIPEVYIYNFDKDIYGETLKIEMIERLRGEEKFRSADELIKQMDKDKSEGIKILNNIN